MSDYSTDTKDAQPDVAEPAAPAEPLTPQGVNAVQEDPARSSMDNWADVEKDWVVRRDQEPDPAKKAEYTEAIDKTDRALQETAQEHTSAAFSDGPSSKAIAAMQDEPETPAGAEAADTTAAPAPPTPDQSIDHSKRAFVPPVQPEQKDGVGKEGEGVDTNPSLPAGGEVPKPAALPERHVPQPGEKDYMPFQP